MISCTVYESMIIVAVLITIRNVPISSSILTDEETYSKRAYSPEIHFCYKTTTRISLQTRRKCQYGATASYFRVTVVLESMGYFAAI